MTNETRRHSGLRAALWVGVFWLLCALLALPAHAAAPQNNYHYPGYDAAVEGEIDLMRYVKSVTLTVNGQEYTPQQLQEMKNNGKPMEMRVGDAASINFRFAQKGDALYLYFPNGIGSDTYADPGYFSLGVTLGEVIDEIRVPGTPGYYVPGGEDWVFPIHMVESTADMEGAISTYGDILVKKVWQTSGQAHPDATVILHYTENGEQKTARRTLSGDNATAKFTIRSGMTDCWLEEDMTGLDGYTSTLTTSEDGKTFTFTNASPKTVAVSKRSLTGTDELPGAKLELYVLSSDGGQTLVDRWTSGETPHEVELNPGRFLLH